MKWLKWSLLWELFISAIVARGIMMVIDLICDWQGAPEYASAIQWAIFGLLWIIGTLLFIKARKGKGENEEISD